MATRYDELKQMLESERDSRKRQLEDSVRARLSSDKILDDAEIELEARWERDLERYEEALRDLEKDQYGRCVLCTFYIEPKRLRALPFATRCKSCDETARGIQQAIPGDLFRDVS